VLESDDSDGSYKQDDEDNFGAPEERLSVSMVSPFLDFTDNPDTKASDEIISSPAFSEKDENSNLSISMMETLIGTSPLKREEEKEAN
jgi:hypothetical protein